MARKTILLIMAMLLVSAIAAYAIPDGATVAVGASETKAAMSAGNTTAQGGNITEVNLTGETQTNAWQGFFGEVSGEVVLEDASGFRFYNWSILTITGEVYTSRDSSIDWTTVDGVTDCTTDETLTGTGTDRVNNTFTRNTTLSGWSVGAVSITDACQTYTNVISAPQTTSFEEIILNATGVTSIYATKIDADTTGYDNTTHDYQVIVPDNSTTATTTYFFFTELV